MTIWAPRLYEHVPMPYARQLQSAAPIGNDSVLIFTFSMHLHATAHTRATKGKHVLHIQVCNYVGCTPDQHPSPSVVLVGVR